MGNSQIGGMAEALVDLGLRTYRAHGLVAFAPTFPEITFVGKGQARATGRGLPDRCVAVKGLGGRLAWIEVKTWAARDRHSETRRLHQYEQMREFAECGGALGFYLVLWRWQDQEEWRIYPISKLTRHDGAILFERDGGLAVPDAGGYPDWLKLVVDSE